MKTNHLSLSMAQKFIEQLKKTEEHHIKQAHKRFEELGEQNTPEPRVVLHYTKEFSHWLLISYNAQKECYRGFVYSGYCNIYEEGELRDIPVKELISSGADLDLGWSEKSYSDMVKIFQQPSTETILQDQIFNLKQRIATHSKNLEKLRREMQAFRKRTKQLQQNTLGREIS